MTAGATPGSLSAGWSLRCDVALAGSVLGLAGIAAEGIGQGGVHGEHAFQAGEAQHPQDQPFGADQLD